MSSVTRHEAIIPVSANCDHQVNINAHCKRSANSNSDSNSNSTRVRQLRRQPEQTSIRKVVQPILSNSSAASIAATKKRIAAVQRSSAVVNSASRVIAVGVPFARKPCIAVVSASASVCIAISLTTDVIQSIRMNPNQTMLSDLLVLLTSGIGAGVGGGGDDGGGTFGGSSSLVDFNQLNSFENFTNATSARLQIFNETYYSTASASISVLDFHATSLADGNSLISTTTAAATTTVAAIAAAATAAATASTDGSIIRGHIDLLTAAASDSAQAAAVAISSTVSLLATGAANNSSLLVGGVIVADSVTTAGGAIAAASPASVAAATATAASAAAAAAASAGGNVSSASAVLNNLTEAASHSNLELIPWWESVPYPQSGYSQLSIIILAFFITCIMILIVIGNLLVCVAIATEKSLKTIQNWFITSLAVSDLLLGLVIVPFSLAHELMGYWIFGQIWCEVHHALDVFLCTASINNLCLISLDRYWSVTQAVEYLKKRTAARAMYMIVFVWVFSGIVSLPPLVGWKNLDKKEGECTLSGDLGYVLYSALGSFYVPAIVMVFVYAKIFVAARSRARKHVKKKQIHAVPEVTNDPTNTKSTTTTTCTSMSNPSPPDFNKDESTAIAGDRTGGECTPSDDATAGGRCSTPNTPISPQPPLTPTLHHQNTHSHSQQQQQPKVTFCLDEPPKSSKSSRSSASICEETIASATLATAVAPLSAASAAAASSTNATATATTSNPPTPTVISPPEIVIECAEVTTTNTRRKSSVSSLASKCVLFASKYRADRKREREALKRLEAGKHQLPSAPISTISASETGGGTSQLCVPMVTLRHNGLASASAAGSADDDDDYLDDYYDDDDSDAIEASAYASEVAARSARLSPDSKSYLSAPKLTRSPYGSSMSINEYDEAVGGDVYLDDTENSSDSVKVKSAGSKSTGGKVRIQRESTTSGSGRSLSSGAGSGSQSLVASGGSGHASHFQTDAERHRRKVAKARERRATFILGLIMGAFVAFWIPFFIMYIVQAVCHDCDVSTYLTIGYWLGFCNSAVNPIIYTVFNRDFRKAFRKILFR